MEKGTLELEELIKQGAMQSHRDKADPSRKLVLRLGAIVLLGAALRLWALAFWTGAIDTEGAEYARIAENLVAGNGYRGIVTPGVELMFPPLYPLLIAVVAYAVTDFELAARLVCVIFGSLLPLGMFGVASRIYDRRVAVLAAAAGAFHPLLINMSAWTYSEASYITVVLGGLYLVMRCMQGARMTHFVVTGVVLGCAYLIRPEGFILPLIGGAFIAAMQWRTIGVTAPKVAVMIGTFAVVAAPYIAFVSSHSGQLRFEGKTAINFEMARRLMAGEEYLEVIYGLGPRLEERGVFLRPNQEVIKNAALSLNDLGRIVGRASRNFKLMIETLCRAPFGTPVLLFLAVLGLFGQPWAVGTRGGQLLLLSVAGAAAASLLTNILADNSRYFWFYVPILLIWAVTGARYFCEWTVATIDGGVSGARFGRRMGPVAALTLVGVMFTASAATVEDRVGGKQSRPTKVAGLWLRGEQTGPVRVMDSQTNLAFHAGAAFVFIPHGSAEKILAYADAKSVDFIVIRPTHPWVAGRTVLEDWGANGLRHPRAELVYASEGNPGEELFIYRWRRQAHGVAPRDRES